MKFCLDERARVDVQDIIEYHSGIRRSLTLRFIDELYDQILLICANPRMGFLMRSGHRQVLLRKFPCALIYEIDAQADLICLVAVGHQHRHPNYWQNRIQEAPAIYELAA